MTRFRDWLAETTQGRPVFSFAAWKHWRKTSHTHHPVDDATENVEALLAMKEMGLKVPSK